MVDKIREAAKLDAENFLKYDSEYRMGYVEAEQPHPLTRSMSQTYQRSVADGVKMLFSVDTQMATRAEKTFRTNEYKLFADTIRDTIKSGNQVIFSGCGSSGRLSMRIEASWREAIAKLQKAYPSHADELEKKIPLVRNIMTGGDYAVIRAVEAFEDSTLLGEAQAEEMNITAGDLLVGVTATGETTSILGTAKTALKNGAKVYMLVCSDPRKTASKMQRVREVFENENCFTMLLDCGPMAVTGSTRMQSSTYEQLASLVALEGALNDILFSLGEKSDEIDYGEFGSTFKDLSLLLASDKVASRIAGMTKKEAEVYEAGGKVTYFSDEFLLDVLTDTTERAPTFMTPPFRSSEITDGEESWAFVKNPTCDTKTAWEKCFLRTPNCISWTREKYESFGMTERQIAKIPKIDLDALEKFEIGNERSDRREGLLNHALWVDGKKAPNEFYDCARYYGTNDSFSFEELGIKFPETKLNIFEHLGMKMLLNVLSTGAMAIMGKIMGNWMINLAMSNKKLVDRSARIVADICGVPYETALFEVYYSYEYCEANGISRSPAGMAIERLSEN